MKKKLLWTAAIVVGSLFCFIVLLSIVATIETNRLKKLPISDYRVVGLENGQTIKDDKIDFTLEYEPYTTKVYINGKRDYAGNINLPLEEGEQEIKLVLINGENGEHKIEESFKVNVDLTEKRIREEEERVEREKREAEEQKRREEEERLKKEERKAREEANRPVQVDISAQMNQSVRVGQEVRLTVTAKNNSSNKSFEGLRLTLNPDFCSNTVIITGHAGATRDEGFGGPACAFEYVGESNKVGPGEEKTFVITGQAKRLGQHDFSIIIGKSRDIKEKVDYGNGNSSKIIGGLITIGF